MNNQAFSKIWILIILIVLITGGTLAWQYLRIPKEEEKVPEKMAEDETTGWQAYRNEEYGFEFKYPTNWQVRVGSGIKQEAALGGGVKYLYEFPLNYKTYYPDATLELTIFNYQNPRLADKGNWEKIANDFFEVGFIITNLEKIDFKGRNALRGRSCQKHFKEERCQTEFTGGRNQQEIEDSLYVNSPDGKWLFIFSLFRFEPSDKENYFTDVYKKFLDSFNFIQSP